MMCDPNAPHIATLKDFTYWVFSGFPDKLLATSPEFTATFDDINGDNRQHHFLTSFAYMYIYELLKYLIVGQ